LKSEKEDKIEFSVFEMYQAADYDANVFTVEEGGELITVYGADYQSPLFSIEKFVDGASKGKKAFINERSASGKEKLRHLDLASNYQSFNKFISAYSPNKIFSANVELFFEICVEQNLTYDSLPKEPSAFSHRYKQTGAEIFNDFIGAIAKKASTPEFKRKVYSREYNAVRNLRSASKYVSDLFSRYSRLLVVRVDFGFKIDVANQLRGVTVTEAQTFLDRFLNNRRGNSLFSDLKGYIWKLESGKEKGYHFHFFLFFGGDKVKKDEHYGKMIGEYWCKVTNGLGIYHNCNANKQKYRRCGIGMVDHSDIEMQGNLLYALKYLFKKEQYLREKFNSKTRVFGRGEKPSQRMSRAGRPRKIEVKID
jgi:hypothetical protein